MGKYGSMRSERPEGLIKGLPTAGKKEFQHSEPLLRDMIPR